MTGDGMPKNQHRLLELDSLRGIAALAVLFFHYTIVLPRFVPDAELVGFTFPYGHYGVELFFIISGFVIFMTLNKCQAASDFVISRIARIYPAFWAAMLLTFTVGSLYPLVGQDYNWTQLAANFTMFHSYAKIDHIDGVYWSLSYELGFYAFMLGLYLLKQLRHIEIICGLLVVAGVIFFFNKQLLPHPLHYLLVINAYSHFFVAGIVFYLIWSDRVTPYRIGLLLSAIVVQGLQEGALGAGITALFIAVFWLAIHSKTPFLRWRVLTYLGTISYSLYLVHHMMGFRVIQFAQEQLGAGSLMSFLMATAFSILLASALNKLVEKPGGRFLKKNLQALKERRMTEKSV